MEADGWVAEIQVLPSEKCCESWCAAFAVCKAHVFSIIILCGLETLCLPLSKLCAGRCPEGDRGPGVARTQRA